MFCTPFQPQFNTLSSGVSACLNAAAHAFMGMPLLGAWNQGCGIGPQFFHTTLPPAGVDPLLAGFIQGLLGHQVNQLAVIGTPCHPLPQHYFQDFQNFSGSTYPGGPQYYAHTLLPPGGPYQQPFTLHHGQAGGAPASRMNVRHVELDRHAPRAFIHDLRQMLDAWKSGEFVNEGDAPDAISAAFACAAGRPDAGIAAQVMSLLRLQDACIEGGALQQALNPMLYHNENARFRESLAEQGGTMSPEDSQFLCACATELFRQGEARVAQARMSQQRTEPTAALTPTPTPTPTPTRSRAAAPARVPVAPAAPSTAPFTRPRFDVPPRVSSGQASLGRSPSVGERAREGGVDLAIEAWKRDTQTAMHTVVDWLRSGIEAKDDMILAHASNTVMPALFVGILARAEALSGIDRTSIQATIDFEASLPKVLVGPARDSLAELPFTVLVRLAEGLTEGDAPADRDSLIEHCARGLATWTASAYRPRHAVENDYNPTSVERAASPQATIA